MSSIINVAGGGGVDLSSLTSGEYCVLFYMLSQFPLATRLTASSSTNSVSSTSNQYNFAYSEYTLGEYLPNAWRHEIDLTNIQSIQFDYIVLTQCTSYFSAMANLNISMSNSSSGGGNTSLISLKSFSHQPDTSYDYNYHTAFAESASWNIGSLTRNRIYQFRITWDISNISSRTAYAYFMTGVRISAFTTTDGKVHTLENLTY